MELKSYQKEVITDLARYLELVVDLQNPAKAYETFWNDKNVRVGFGGMPNYVNLCKYTSGRTPCVCKGAHWRGQNLYRCKFFTHDI